MVDWDPNDYRIFVGDLGNEVNDDILYKAFSHYGSIKKAKMVKNKITGKNKGASPWALPQARCCTEPCAEPHHTRRRVLHARRFHQALCDWHHSQTAFQSTRFFIPISA